MSRLAGWRDYSKAEIKYDNSNAWRFVLSGCLVEHFNISGSERVASPSRIKSAGRTRWRIPWGEVVSVATRSVRFSVARSVVWYVDVVSATKCWSVSRTSIYSVTLHSWFDLKLNRREAIDVVQGVDKRFTGWRIPTRTWNNDKNSCHTGSIINIIKNELTILTIMKLFLFILVDIVT